MLNHYGERLRCQVSDVKRRCQINGAAVADRVDLI